MGKTKNKMRKGRKTAPTGLPSAAEIEKEEEEIGANGDSLVQSILEKLQHSSVEEKECACCSMSIALEKNRSTWLPVFLQNNVVRAMAPLLVDRSCVVRHSVAGALRNLSAMGHEVCDEMVEQDVMTPLVALFKQYTDGWTPSKNKGDDKIDSKLEIVIEATHLLWNLCESNNTALSIFNREALLPVIIQFLNPTTYGWNLSKAAAQCIHTVSEDNPEVIELLGQPSLSLPVETIISLPLDDDSSVVLLRALGAGILLNTYHGKLSGCSTSILSAVMQVIANTLERDVASSVVSLLEKQRNRKENSATDQLTSSQENNEIEAEATVVEDYLSAQVVVLEMLTNICCSEGGDWEDVDGSDASDEFQIEDDMACEAVNQKFPLSVASEIHEAVLSHNLVSKVICKILTPLPEGFVNFLPGRTTMSHTFFKRLTTLQCRSLLCLHNLVSCLDIEELDGPERLHSVWTNLAQLALKHTIACPPNPENPNYCNAAEHIEFLEALTSSLRALLQKLAEGKVPQLNEVGERDFRILCELTELCTESGVRINIINIVGTIGRILAGNLPANPAAPTILKDIGLFLLDLCSREVDLTVTAEALDAIFDVFGEDNVDSVCCEINLVEKLKQVLPTLKYKLQSQRRSLGTHYPVVMTAKSNLVRFIKYKTGQRQGDGHRL